MGQTLIWDGFGLQSRYAGVGRHAFELSQALARKGLLPRILPSHPQIDQAFNQQWALEPSTWQPDWMRLKPFCLWRASRQLQQLPASQSGVIHGLSNFNLPATGAAKPWKKVLTVHDMIPFLEPRVVSRSLSAFLRWQMPRALQRADLIICVSAWTEQHLITLYPEVRGRTRLVPNGLAPLPASLETGRGKLDGAGSRLLTISRDEPYKRLAWIGTLLEQLPPAFSWDVVSDASGAAKLMQDFGSLVQRQRLRIHQQISDVRMQELFFACDVYVHPSLWEGYCLPAAQAIQSLKPVVYCAGSGTDETVGAAGQGLSREAQIPQWKAVIEAMTAAGAADEWAERCRTRCLSFATWDEVAARTMEVYDIID